MEDQNQNSSRHGSSSSSSSPNHDEQRISTEPAVRSRWTPKPEQIVILESIFNSGLVNPPKDETVRIRKLLEKFGAVADANIFYWFQNRRSRSRRRLRQLQAATLAYSEEHSRNSHNHNTQMTPAQPQPQELASHVVGTIPFENHHNLAMPIGFASSACNNFTPGSSSSSSGIMGDDGVAGDETLYSISGQMGFPELGDQNSSVTSLLCPSDSGFITVFINGVPTDIPRGPIDMKALFGQDVVLVHSTGVPLPTNEFGFLLQSLQHGQSYFLVSRSA